ncbi:MAG: hypothetical protein ABIG44_07220 [Planctomycetota bacterium]
MLQKDRPPGRHYPWLYALSEGRLPPTVTCRGVQFELVDTFKHDFFAATGLYRGSYGLAVLKLGRTADFLAVPLKWIGEFLTRREMKLYQAARGLPGIPDLIGPVGTNGFLHVYIPGRPLERREQVSDTFFADLESLLRRLHERHIAYVDLNKRQNILLGADGQPYLFDFQIGLHLPPTSWRRLWPVRWFLKRFQKADRYHFLKHKRRLRPDLLTATENEQVSQLSVWIRLHRWIARPLTHLRRRMLKSLKKKETVEVTGSSAK